MFDSDHAPIYVILFFLLVIGIAVCWLNASYESDCQQICHMRGTEMNSVTNYGCLCADGTVIGNHGSR